MQLNEIKKIAIIGAGTMGSGIAQVSALAGYETILFDIEPRMLPRAMASIEANLAEAVKRNKLSANAQQAALNRIYTTTFFADLQADVFIEAIIENLDIKLEAFQQIAKNNAHNCILATNTSSIPITRLAAHLPNPERIVGMHFFNPAHLMRLVEVIAAPSTSPQVVETIRQLTEKMGKVPVTANDAPGFIVNRVARHYYVEALQLLEEGVADHQTIDALLESCGFKMGAFKLMDLIGVDVNFSVTKSMFDSFHYAPRFRPSRIQQQKVEAGHHGRKTGKGFYEY